MQEIAVPINNRETRQPVPARAASFGPGEMNVGDIERLASALGGGVLAMYGLRNAPAGLPLALAGSYLLYRGVSGHCPLYQALAITTAGEARTAHVEKVFTINVEPAELYSFWRDFTNLPRFMQHLEEVRVLDERRSHWVARGPAGTRVEWDAEIFLEKPNELIAWRSLPDAAVSNAGSVRFQPAPGGRGCEVRVVMEYVPPAGKLGQFVARLMGEEPGQQVDDDLRHLKMVLETGEIATSEMRPEPKGGA